MTIAGIKDRLEKEVPNYEREKSAPTCEIVCEWCATIFRAAVPLGVLIRTAGRIIEGTENDGRFICDWCESRPGPPKLGPTGWV